MISIICCGNRGAVIEAALVVLVGVVVYVLVMILVMVMIMVAALAVLLVFVVIVVTSNDNAVSRCMGGGNIYSSSCNGSTSGTSGGRHDAILDFSYGENILNVANNCSAVLHLSSGTDRFAQDIKDMLGFKPGLYWQICWKYIAPLFILVSIGQASEIIAIALRVCLDGVFPHRPKCV